MTHDHLWPNYRPPEPPTGWHEQDGLLILEALDHYAREEHLTQGQELRAYQLLESIARLHGTVSLGATHHLGTVRIPILASRLIEAARGETVSCPQCGKDISEEIIEDAVE